MDDRDAWWNVPLRAIDRMLRSWSAKAQKVLRRLRVARFFVLLLFLVPLAAAGVAIGLPWFLPYAVAIIAVYVAIPLIGVFFLLGLPLKAKSVVRLIDKGYPANVKELAIRSAARKLHEQSIETEELLVDTALNESRKLLRKYRARAERLKKELDDMDDPDLSASDDK